ncbi:MAG: NADH:flavin oxidoreductase [Deltaproteobacteria bacterium HGW-Deltaproteobacteria-19]|jgi:2,4-dienoyl-CoA reductase (NADPH2)|nr:MAG: NADH:flavin oxidoreductase [Deltaproteobacteria bacterium HGW-Deltaproteobacteria-19]
MEFIKLLEPITIRRLTVPNRMVMPSMGMHFTDQYEFNRRYQDFYRARAEGGVGLMIIGPVAIDRIGAGSWMPGLFEDRQVEEFRPFLAELHRGTRTVPGTQLFHAGRNATAPFFEGVPALAPSAVPSRLMKQMPRAMTWEDIETVKESFARSAVRARDAGFDFIEIIACTGYLISQFLSPVTNFRTDDYGGSFENRMRFGLEVFRKVREAVGPDTALGTRVAGNDFMDGGCTNREIALFCAEAEKAGIDAINVTGGWHETNVPQLTCHVPPGAYVYLARGVKDRVGIPVFASNRLGDPELAERVLRSGAADMVCLGRPLLADPDLPRKILEGRPEEIVRCIACQNCFDSIATGGAVCCALNPLMGREGEFRLEKAAVPKKIYVAGGGPAGMEFAAAAAGRGHDVTLFEKEDRLGGQIEPASSPPGKQAFGSVTADLERRLKPAGVRVRRKSPLTMAKIRRGKPDVLVVATGAVPMEIRVPGIDRPHVVGAWDVLRGRIADIGRRVVVVGGNAVGCETAEWIASQDIPDPETFAFLAYHGAETQEELQAILYRHRRQITVIDMVEKMAAGTGRASRWVLMKNLRLCGIELRPGAKLLEITDGAVIVEANGGKESIPADTVVMAVGSRSVDGLAREVGREGLRVVTIGDAKSPRKIVDAIREGFEEAMKI